MRESLAAYARITFSVLSDDALSETMNSIFLYVWLRSDSSAADKRFARSFVVKPTVTSGPFKIVIMQIILYSNMNASERKKSQEMSSLRFPRFRGHFFLRQTRQV